LGEPLSVDSSMTHKTAPLGTVSPS
jgi:hypothetical protein